MLLPCRAQQSAQTWTGTVRNANGAPVPGARIQLAAEGAPTEPVQATSGADGSFRVGPVRPGQYRLSLQLSSSTGEAAQLVLAPLKAVSVSFVVQAGGESLTVMLGVGRAGAQTANSGGEELSSHEVSSLPLNKRDFSQLLLLAAGTMTDANGATNFTQQFAINGQRGVEATFAMDGADTTDPEMGGATFTNFDVDAVEEIQSSSGWMPAEIGFGASGFTDIRTRSGASGFHGSVFEFVRNSAFDARNFFDHATPATPGRLPPFRRNEFGFTNGGAVILPHVYDGRGKTFYFGQYQGFRQVLGTTQVFPVPTAAQRPSAVNGNIVDDPIEIQQPDGSFVSDTLFVPVNPAIAAILARYPLPDLPSGAYGVNTYAASSKVITNADQFSIRIDHKIGSKDQFLARFTFDNLTGPTTNPDQTAIDPQFGVQYIDRQRNVMGAWTHTASPRLVFESLIGIERSTPGFPTPDLTDPAVKFNDSTFEGFNTAGGSVAQIYGNLFQGRQLVSWIRGSHAMKAGFEARLNRDGGYFGTSPNGEYDFGGGSAYSAATDAAGNPVTIQSQSGTHNVPYGSLLPDTVSGFLSGSPAAYTVAIASPQFSSGVHIGPAAINRDSFAAFVQDNWKLTPRFALDYGVRWELYTPLTERAHRTSSLLKANGVTEYVVNPQPGYQTDWKGWGPRIQGTWQMTSKFQAHAGGGITIIQPNLFQDNYLTGGAPFAVYPRLVGTQGAPVPYGFKITSSQLPVAVTPTGQPVIPSGNPKLIQPNTVMDVDLYEKQIAALGASGVVSDLNLNAIDRNFSNARLYTWTAGLEHKVGSLTADANYVGTASNHLPRTSFPNAFPYASPGFAPDTTFNSAGQVTGGLGVEQVITATAHSTYHALQTSLAGTVGHGGPGVQASYTWSKSIDDTSQVIGGTGSTGAVAQGFPQDPNNTHPEKGPSSFDVTHGFALSMAQDLHGEKASFLNAVPRRITGGWELLSISSVSSGAPFTVFSGVQQTGYGAIGVDRPDQVGKPNLSTARADRADYFGLGLDNPSYFNIPIHVPDGTGPNQGRFGTLGRNTFRGPAYYDYDFALIKDTPFGQRKSGAELVDLQFRSEFFNLFNIVDMGLPANIVNGTGFGEIGKTAGTSRQIQFSLKLIY